MILYAHTKERTKMSDKNVEIYEETTLPLIPLRGLVAFPAVQLNIEIMRPMSLKAFTTGATMYDANAAAKMLVQ